MIEDSRGLADGTSVQTDVCVVGAGAAGITIARALTGSGLRVVLLESGGLAFDPEIQDLYGGEVVPQDSYALDSTRLRYFGGTTNHWAGFCRPLDPIDFRARDWVPGSGWPISAADLMPYYQRAQATCQLGRLDYDGQSWAQRIGREAFQALPVDEALFRSSVFQYSPPTRFGSVYREELARSPSVHVLLYANLVNIDVSEGDVAALDVRAWKAGAIRVQARAYVLACGAIDNARILLASNANRPRGIGNDNDLVGRFFAEHPIVEVGEIALQPPRSTVDLYDGWTLAGTSGQGVLVLSEAAMTEHQLPNAGFFVFPQYDEELAEGFRAFLEIAQAARRGTVPDDLGTKLKAVLSDLDGVALPGLRRLFRRGRLASRMRLRLFSEQVPNPDSRVLLTQDRDALGVPRIRLEWRLTEADHRGFEKSFEVLGRAFGAAELGRIRFEVTSRDVGNGSHHMGTTRMSADPGRGVVDANCRVHGVANLYVAGSSVFPTTGCSNPTLTIVALAERLADHLASTYRR